jgi:uncharacterized membrane protein YjjB (DUF3815 family)
MLVAGVLGIVVGTISEMSILSKQARLILEIIAGLLVGFIAGVIALQWPNDTCYGAIALGGVLEILQGFRVVFAVIELMSRHTVSGTADLLEGVLFTGLIAYFLRAGQTIAAALYGSATQAFPLCTNGIPEIWYLLFVPLAAFSWSGLFVPRYEDLPGMCFHGCLAYAVSWGCSKSNMSDQGSSFIAATAVTFSAGIFSRLTGRQALGNAVAGLYVLLPGAYLVREIFNPDNNGIYSTLLANAIVIGAGGFAGTLFCSLQVVGTNRGLLRMSGVTHSVHGRQKSVRKNGPGAMLFF